MLPTNFVVSAFLPVSIIHRYTLRRCSWTLRDIRQLHSKHRVDVILVINTFRYKTHLTLFPALHTKRTSRSLYTPSAQFKCSPWSQSAPATSRTPTTRATYLLHISAVQDDTGYIPGNSLDVSSVSLLFLRAFRLDVPSRSCSWLNESIMYNRFLDVGFSAVHFSTTGQSGALFTCPDSVMFPRGIRE